MGLSPGGVLLGKSISGIFILPGGMDKQNAMNELLQSIKTGHCGSKEAV